MLNKCAIYGDSCEISAQDSQKSGQNVNMFTELCIQMLRARFARSESKHRTSEQRICITVGLIIRLVF